MAVVVAMIMRMAVVMTEGCIVGNVCCILMTLVLDILKMFFAPTRFVLVSACSKSLPNLVNDLVSRVEEWFFDEDDCCGFVEKCQVVPQNLLVAFRDQDIEQPNWTFGCRQNHCADVAEGFSDVLLNRVLNVTDLLQLSREAIPECAGGFVAL